MRLPPALVLATAACSGPVTAPATSEPQAPAPVVAEVAPRDADAVAVAPDAAVAAPVDAAPQPLTIAASCRGANIRLRNSQDCVVQAPSDEELPAGIVASLDPSPVRVRKGAVAPVDIVLTNTTAAEVTLLLDCRRFGWERYEMHDKKRRVDVTGDCGPGGGGCGGPTYGFALPPNGQARYEILIAAKIEDSCGGARDRGDVPKGTYELVVHSGLAGTQTTSIKVY